jgi:hypothetical protein
MPALQNITTLEVVTATRLSVIKFGKSPVSPAPKITEIFKATIY